MLADVFQAEICPLRVANSSALGGALRAAQAVEGRSFSELATRFSAPEHALRVRPDSGARGAYEALGRAFEARLVELLTP